MNGEEPPFKRRRRQMTILMLPDDLVLNCLARFSRLYYPTLSLFSKRFRSLLASTELYQTRILFGRTETCLYVCFVSIAALTNYVWSLSVGYLIALKKSWSGFHLIVHLHWSDVVVVGPNIYVIGGLIHIKDNIDSASSSVMVMDCRSHEWRDARSMRVPRALHSACVLDGKIYVTGGCKNLDSTNWMEVFDTKTQTWEFLNIHSEEICKGFEYQNVGYEGTVYVRSDEKNVTYKLHKGRWRAADLAMNSGWRLSSCHCVIENVFFRCRLRTIDWYDSEERSWTALKGLGILSPMLYRSVPIKLTDYGGK